MRELQGSSLQRFLNFNLFSYFLSFFLVIPEMTLANLSIILAGVLLQGVQVTYLHGHLADTLTVQSITLLH